jgi:hypothetical protein
LEEGNSGTEPPRRPSKQRATSSPSLQDGVLCELPSPERHKPDTSPRRRKYWNEANSVASSSPASEDVRVHTDPGSESPSRSIAAGGATAAARILRRDNDPNPGQHDTTERGTVDAFKAKKIQAHNTSVQQGRCMNGSDPEKDKAESNATAASPLKSSADAADSSSRKVTLPPTPKVVGKSSRGRSSK